MVAFNTHPSERVSVRRSESEDSDDSSSVVSAPYPTLNAMSKNPHNPISDNTLAAVLERPSRVPLHKRVKRSVYTLLNDNMSTTLSRRLDAYLTIFLAYLSYLFALSGIMYGFPTALLTTPSFLGQSGAASVPFSYFFSLAMKWTTISIPGFIPTHESGLLDTALSTAFTPRTLWTFVPLSAIGTVLALWDMKNLVNVIMAVPSLMSGRFGLLRWRYLSLGGIYISLALIFDLLSASFSRGALDAVSIATAVSTMWCKIVGGAGTGQSMCVVGQNSGGSVNYMQTDDYSDDLQMDPADLRAYYR
jgi:hypothetical protein